MKVLIVALSLLSLNALARPKQSLSNSPISYTAPDGYKYTNVPVSGNCPSGSIKIESYSITYPNGTQVTIAPACKSMSP